MATRPSPTQPSTPNLKSLPPELRLQIYHHLLPRTTFRLTLSIHQPPRGPVTVSATYPPVVSLLARCSTYTGILRTCRGVFEEAMPVLYQRLDVVVLVSLEDVGGCVWSGAPFPLLRMQGREVGLWRFLRRVEVVVRLKDEESAPGPMGYLLGMLVARTGRLDSLRVTFTSEQDSGIPSWLPEVCQPVKRLELRPRGHVNVRVDDGSGDEPTDVETGYEDLCAEIERAIRANSGDEI